MNIASFLLGVTIVLVAMLVLLELFTSNDSTIAKIVKSIIGF